MVDFKALSATVVDTAFRLADSVLVSCTFYSVVPGTYVVSTGISSATTVATLVDAIVGVFDQREVDGQSVRVGDQKLIIRRTEMATEPKVDDYLIRTTGSKRLDVVKIISEPTDAVWILAVREGKK